MTGAYTPKHERPAEFPTPGSYGTLLYRGRHRAEDADLRSLRQLVAAIKESAS
jgi:hypothetical protein